MKTRDFLKTLARARNKRQILKSATPAQLNAIRNICYNICRGRFKLAPKVYKKLVAHRRTIRELADKKKLKTVTGLRKKLLLKGGFLGLLLPAILSLASTVAGRAVSKAVGV